MNIVSPRTLRAFWTKHPQAEVPLKVWQKAARKGDFADLHAVREVWPHADLVRVKNDVQVLVFNIGGNKYRLVVAVSWLYKTVHIKKIMTHAEYDVWNKGERSI